MNANVDVSIRQNDECEEANIRIGSFGSVTELRFGKDKLNAVAIFDSVDIKRLFEVLAIAESKRVDPNPETIKSLKYLKDRFDYLDEDKSRLHLSIEIESPISSCGSVRLEPGYEIDIVE